MNTPSITPAQIVAIVQPIIATLVAFGVPMTDQQTTAILGLATALSTVLILGDTLIRRARANNAKDIAAGRAIEAQIEAQVEPDPGPVFVEGKTVYVDGEKAG